MSETNGFVEHMEHAAHGGHGEQEHYDHSEHNGHGGQSEYHDHEHKRPFGKYIGVSIACLGVLLALCSALESGQRTELITTMLEQNNTAMKFQSISTKYRVMMAQLKQLDSLCPEMDKFTKWEGEVRSVAKMHGSADADRIIKVVRLENCKNLNCEIPTRADLKDFAESVRNLSKERDAAEKWTESYEPAVKAHENAGEQYERAQLCCEIGIVVASIALLFSNKKVWSASLVLGLTALLLVGFTWIQVGGSLGKADKEIARAQSRFNGYRYEESEKEADEDLLRSVETEGSPNLNVG